VKDGEVLRMREVDGYEIPARGHFELRPGGPHLMLVDLRQPLKEGEKVPVTLRFKRAGEKTVHLEVRRLAGPPSPARHGHPH